MKLLVTGFGKFDQFTENPSSDLARMVHGRSSYQVQLYGLELDVSWNDSWPVLQQAVHKLRPDGVLAFGLAPEPSMRLETVAKNQTCAIGDYFGNFPGQPLIATNGLDTYSSTLPVHWLLEQLNVRKHPKIPTRLSTDAGRYLCNYIFYSIMHHLDKAVPWRGFVHIPAYPEDMVAPSYSRSDLLNEGLQVVRLVSKWMNEQRQLVS